MHAHPYSRKQCNHGQAKDIIKEDGKAPLPMWISQHVVEYLGQMVCVEDGQAKLVKNMTSSASSLKGGGSTLQRNVQKMLMNQYFLEVHKRTLVP
jgi:hypothetical protein